MEGVWNSVPEFPQFKDLTLEEKPVLDAVFNRFPPLISEFTHTNLFIWRYKYQLKITHLGGFLCLLADQGQDSFSFLRLAGEIW